MRSLILAAAAFALSAAANATGTGVFDGTVHFTSSNCGGVASSWNLNIFYYPPNLGSNGPGTSIALRQPFDVNYSDLRNYRLDTGDINGKLFVTMQGTRVFVSDNSTGGYTWQPAARITKQTPATIDATTNKLTLVGDIQSYDGPGCDAHFDATLYSYPLP